MNTAGVPQKVKAISLRMVILILSFLFSLWIFIRIADEMVLEKENGFDVLVFQKVDAITSPFMTRFMLSITFFGSDYFLLPAYILLSGYFILFKKTRRLSFDVVAVGITSTILLFTLKFLFHRERPAGTILKNIKGFSFPSGHSFCSFTFFGLLIYILWTINIKPSVRWILTIIFFLFACLVAFSRIYLHVHYASDVVAGFFLCIAWLGLSFWLIKKIQHRKE